LEAIRARIQGVWNDPNLVKFLPLSISIDKDVLRIIEQTLIHK